MLSKILKRPFRLKSLRCAQFVTAQQPAKNIDVLIKGNTSQLKVNYSKTGPINFFLGPTDSFKTLQDLLKAQFPNSDVSINFANSNYPNIQSETLLFDFLGSTKKGEVSIIVDDDSFKLNNTGSHNLTNLIVPIVDKMVQDQGSLLYWYQKCLQNKIDQSHAGTLSHLVRGFSNNFRGPRNNLMGNNEIANVFKENTLVGMEPIRRKLQECYAELNALDAEIKGLEKEKEKIEKLAERRIALYQKLIILIGIIHLVSFYYMIFEVDWLGWDIIEPITYTVQCLSVIIGIRFYLKYGVSRGFDTMREIARAKLINRNKDVKSLYNLTLEKLAEKKSLKKLNSSKIDLYLNRKNYHQFFLDMNPNTLKKVIDIKN